MDVMEKKTDTLPVRPFQNFRVLKSVNRGVVYTLENVDRWILRLQKCEKESVRCSIGELCVRAVWTEGSS